MDIVQLYQDFSVDFVTEGHKHSRPGWVNVECPFCTGNPGYHLSFNIKDNFYLCWRCGWHPVSLTISKLINLPEPQVRKLIRKYGLYISSIVKTPAIEEKKIEHRLPSGVIPLTASHIRYLQTRNFDPPMVSKIWTLSGTGPVSSLDGLNFRHRLIIPIIWNSQEVSFTSRDITDKHPLRYITCPQNRELINHKNILYGKQEYWKSTGICVEGPTDAWRFGVYSFATFGIKYTHTQLRLISKTFKRVAVCYDDDPQAVVQANKMVADLKFRGVDAFRVPIVGDPGSMDQVEADYLVKQLIY